MTVRKATPADAEVIHSFTIDLAEYERSLDKVELTVENFESYIKKGGHFNALIAEIDGKAVGMALWYKRFSTWVGDYTHLEDLYIQPEFRGQGIAKALVTELAAETLRLGMKRLRWEVMAWNEPAVKMYQKIGADILPDWRVCQMDESALKKLLKTA